MKCAQSLALKALLVILTAASPVATCLAETGDPWIQQVKLIASSGASNGYFGFATALSLDGNTAIVGAPYWQLSTSLGLGKAYVFVRAGNTWTLQQELQPSDGVPGDEFGNSLALSKDGNTALIGANGGSLAGRAYVFVRTGNTWSQQQKLQPVDSAVGDFFGGAAALSDNGDTALIGASGNGNYIGAAYVFVRGGTSWSQQQQLKASNGQSQDNFGLGVALSGNGMSALIGAPHNQYSANKHGSAYVFTFNGTSWRQQQELTPGDSENLDQFGWSASMSEDGRTALIGAPSRNVAGHTMAAAYVFTSDGTGWTQQQELTPNDSALADQFGWSVSLSQTGRTALIGAPSHNGIVGAAYVFASSGGHWSQQQELTAGDGAMLDDFGYWTLALSGDGQTALIGAPGKNGQTGAAYVFVTAIPTHILPLFVDCCAPVPFGDPISIAVQLVIPVNEAIVGAPITYSIYSQGSITGTAGAADLAPPLQACSVLTDSKGIGACRFTPIESPGAYTLVAGYQGSVGRRPVLLPASVSTPFTIIRAKTTVTYTGPSVIEGNAPATLFGKLSRWVSSDDDGKAGAGAPISGRLLTLSIGSQSCQTGPTGADGTARCSLAPSTPGEETAKATFTGDSDYESSSDSEKVTVVR